MSAQHTGGSGKERRIRPAMIYADPFTHIKTASLPAFPHWTAMKIKGETPPIKSQELKVIAVESRPQKGTLRIQQLAQPHQLENQLRHAWRQLTRDLLCGGWSGEVWRICHFPLWSLMKHTFWLMVARGVASAVTGIKMGRPVAWMAPTGSIVLHLACRWPRVIVLQYNYLETQTIFALSA